MKRRNLGPVRGWTTQAPSPQACHCELTSDDTHVRFGSQPTVAAFSSPFLTTRGGLGQHVANLSRIHTCAPHTDPREIRCQTEPLRKNITNGVFGGVGWGVGRRDHPLSLALPPYCLAAKSPPLML